MQLSVFQRTRQMFSVTVVCAAKTMFASAGRHCHLLTSGPGGWSSLHPYLLGKLQGVNGPGAPRLVHSFWLQGGFGDLADAA